MKTVIVLEVRVLPSLPGTFGEHGNRDMYTRGGLHQHLAPASYPGASDSPKCEYTDLESGTVWLRDCQANPASVLHCPALISDIASRLADDLPHGASVGRDGSGRFLTTRLKRIPTCLVFCLRQVPGPPNCAVWCFQMPTSIGVEPCMDVWLHHRHGL